MAQPNDPSDEQPELELSGGLVINQPRLVPDSPEANELFGDLLAKHNGNHALALVEACEIAANLSGSVSWGYRRGPFVPSE